LPENQLNGEFTIEVDNYENSDINFSVEEYKRPKFYTEFEKSKKAPIGLMIKLKLQVLQKHMQAIMLMVQL